MRKFLINYETFLSGTRSLADSILDSFEPSVVLAIPRGGLSFGHVLSLEFGTRLNLFDLQSTDEELTIFLKSFTRNNIVIADDSIGTGATFSRVSAIMSKTNISWRYATFYVDGGVNLRDKKYYPVQCVMQTHQWVVMPWEDPDKIEIGDQGSLFRNGTDPYQSNPLAK